MGKSRSNKKTSVSKSVQSPILDDTSPKKVPIDAFLASKKLQKRKAHSTKKQRRKDGKQDSAFSPPSKTAVEMSALERGLWANENAGTVEVKAATGTVSRSIKKMSKQVAMREVVRMRLVLQHPDFIKNPWETVNAHLSHLVGK